jgi:response regulator NasT
MAIARAVQGGLMGFLVEPVDPATLRATLEVAVRRFQELLALRREVEGLRRTLEARKLIERAKGLLMEMESISEHEAFTRIRQKSMDTGRPMAEIGRAILLAAEVSGRNR